MAIDCCARIERFFGHDGRSIQGVGQGRYLEGNGRPCFGMNSLEPLHEPPADRSHRFNLQFSMVQ